MAVIVVLVLLGPIALGAPTPVIESVIPIDGPVSMGDAFHPVDPWLGMDERLEADLASGATGPVLVELTFDRRPTELDAEVLRMRYGAELTYVYNNWDEILVRLPYGSVPALMGLPGVVGIEKILPVRLAMETAATTTRVAQAEGVHDGFDHTLAVHETLGFRGEGIVIAIMDTGVDTSHAALQGKLVSKVDPLTGLTLYGAADVKALLAAVGCIDPIDVTGHGTHVAGIALGSATAEVSAGIAPAARLVDIGILGAGYPGVLDGIGPGMDWVLDFNAGRSCYGDPGEDHIDILSMSLMFPTNDPTHSYNRKVTDIVRSGVTVVLAAGNTSPSTQWDTTTPPPESLSTSAEGAIIVGNSNDNGTTGRGDDLIACNSARGPRQSDETTVPDLMPHIAAPGTNIWAASRDSGTGGESRTGTSMSAPHIAGIAALMLQANPGLRPVAHADWRQMGEEGAVPIRDLLVQSAEYKTATRDHCPLYQETDGMFDLPWNDAWGYGLVDAYEAVRMAMGE